MLTTRQLERKTESGEAKKFTNAHTHTHAHSNSKQNGFQIKIQSDIEATAKPAKTRTQKEIKTEHIHDENKVDFAVAIC